MPEMCDVARHFDDADTYDGYNPLGVPLFQAQFSTFVEAAPDGSTSNRRVLSVAPDVTLPLRRVLKLHDELWVAGTGLVDMFQNVAVRKSYWLKKIFANFNLSTPAQACNGVPGLDAYGHRVFLKSTVNGVSDAGYEPFWNLYFGANETAVAGTFLRDSFNTWYRCRVTYQSDEGFRMVEADQLSPPVAVIYGSNPVYNPELDVMTSTPVSVQGFALQPSKLYKFLTNTDEKYFSGDQSLITSVPLTPESTISVAGEVYQVLDCTPELDAFVSHIRRP